MPTRTEFGNWLELRIPSSRNYVRGIGQIEQKLDLLGMPYLDLESAWQEDNFGKVFRRLLELKEDARTGGEEYLILTKKSVEPVRLLRAYIAYLNSYKKFLEENPTNLGLQREGFQSESIGEGTNHKAMRLRVLGAPELIVPGLRAEVTKTELELLSGDKVDVVSYAKEKTVAIEVKSQDSNWNDLRRGVYQCVKYRAVLIAQCEPNVECWLVTQRELGAELKHLARRLGVKTRVLKPSQ